MADNSKRVSELQQSANVTSSDRVLILKSPSLNASVRTITVANLAATMTKATELSAGVVRIGNGINVDANGTISTNFGEPLFISNANTFTDFAVQNTNNGINTSTDIALYNNLGDYAAGTGPYIDIGIDGSNYSNALYGIYGPNDGYVYVDGAATGGGNLILGTAQDKTIKFHAGGVNPNNLIMTVNSSYMESTIQTGNPYTRVYQDHNTWGTYSEDDETYANSGWAWIETSLPNANNPSFKIENKRADTNETYTWTYNANGHLVLPSSGRIYFNQSPNQYIEGNMQFRIYSSDGILSTVENESSNTFSIVTQLNNNWEAYSTDDVTGAESAWSWIRTDLTNVADPFVIIENQRGDTGNNYRWHFGADGILTLPANGHIDGAVVISDNTNIFDELFRPLLNPNALDINTDGGTSTSIFATRDEAFTGGGSTTIFGKYEAALDGGFSHNNRHSTSYIDGGGANVL